MDEGIMMLARRIGECQDKSRDLAVPDIDWRIKDAWPVVKEVVIVAACYGADYLTGSDCG